MTDGIEWRTNDHWAPTNDFMEMSLAAIIAIFLMGIGNFALQKAILESGHPMLAMIPRLFRKAGGRWLLTLEFAILFIALAMATNGFPGIALVYAIYTSANGFAAWLILRGRV